MTKIPRHPLAQLSEIRELMERSSRFIGLSGLAGVSAGVSALLGAAAIYFYFGMLPFEPGPYWTMGNLPAGRWGIAPVPYMLLIGGITLLSAMAGSIYFTTRRAKRKRQHIWDATTRRVIINLAIPLGAGGLFCLALLYHGLVGLVAPATLIFYGVGLVNASKYTLEDLRYLGLCEIGLGLWSCFVIGYGLEFWTIGFGLLHIVYGLRMYVKYEQGEIL